MQTKDCDADPLTPEQLAELLIAERWFLSSPLSKGYESFAVIQLLNKDGRRVELALSALDLRDLDAEAQAIRAMIRRVWEQHGTPDVAAGRMMVVVDHCVCADDKTSFTACTTRLIDFARELRLAGLDLYLPRRDKMVGDGRAAGKPATLAAGISDRAEPKVLPELHLRFLGLDAIAFLPPTSTMQQR